MGKIAPEARHYLNLRSELVNNRAMTFIGAQITSGKTLGAKMYLLANFLEKGVKSFFLCRTQEEKKALIFGFCDEILEKGAMNGYDFPKDLQLSTHGTEITADGEPWCIVATIREADKYGRNAWPSYDIIYLDEFIMDARWKYVPNEFEQVMKFCKNVFRTRPNCRLIASGNSHDFDNPYFSNLTSGYFEAKTSSFKLFKLANKINPNRRNNLFKFVDIVRPGEKGKIKHEKGVEKWYWSYPVLGELSEYETSQIESVLSICAPSYARKAIQNQFINYDVDDLVRLSQRAFQIMKIRVNEDHFYLFSDGRETVVSSRGDDLHPSRFGADSSDLRDGEIFLDNLTKIRIQNQMNAGELKFTDAFNRARFKQYFGKTAV